MLEIRVFASLHSNLQFTLDGLKSIYIYILSNTTTTYLLMHLELQLEH